MGNNDASNTLKLMIANRSEIALRIIHSASLFPVPSLHKPSTTTSFETLSIHTPSEANALHVKSASHSIALPGEGPSQYLNIDSLISIAKQNQVFGVHPGYGLLSENSQFARKVIENGMVWIGPTPEQLEILGEKTKARDLAKSLKVPLLPGTKPISSTSEFQDFFNSQPPNSKILLKAVSGGGGKGMRVLNSSQPLSELNEIFKQASREAKGAFGDERIYLELFLENARHVEVQLIGDGQDVQHLFERDCSLQRNHQKLVEISPSPSLDMALRSKIIDAALRMGRKVGLKSLATVEFLVKGNEFYFMEINPRIQVEHTITEQVTGLDLVNLQLQIALGAKLSDLGLSSPPRFPTFTSVQFRLNAESYSKDGSTSSEAGQLNEFYIPQGHGIRIDTAAHAPFLSGSKKVHYSSNPAFDSLLAKIIFTSSDFGTCLKVANKTLEDVRIQGFKTNLSLLQALAQDQNVVSNHGIHTNYVLENFSRLLEASKSIEESKSKRDGSDSDQSTQETDDDDEKKEVEKPTATSKAFYLPMAAVLTSSLSEGDTFSKGQEVGIIEAMKMEHVLRAEEESGTIEKVLLKPGQFGNAGSILYYYQPNSTSSSNSSSGTKESESERTIDLEEIRPELADLQRSKSYLTDEFRKQAVAKLHSKGHLTARENLELLLDDVENGFIEFGDLALAAQRSRIDDQRLRETTSGDGVICGFGSINKELLKGSQDSSNPGKVGLCIYDYLVLAGTQGYFHHLKLDRLFKNVIDARCPLVLYAQGGGGRPGDVDVTTEVAGLKTPSFALMGHIRASGLPSIGVANGYTFAGNAALLGTCDLIISTTTAGTSLGMSGPAIIAGAKMGEYKAEEIGPPSVHLTNGNVDILVESEKETAIVVKKLLSFFQGPLVDTSASLNLPDQRILRHLIPKDRKRAYDVREIIRTFSDQDSFIEVGSGYGQSLVTGFLRIDGRPLAIIASSVISPLGGAIDTSSALKATRFLDMLTRTKACHLMVAADTPGFMVGVAAEAAGPPGQVKQFGEWFGSAAAFQQAGGMIFAVTLRKAYGLGAQALLGGSTLSNFFSCSWPTGEFAGMGPEGAVRLAMKKELAAIEDKTEREELYKQLVEAVYERGKAENTASMLEIDTVIDPVDTRKWLINGLNVVGDLKPTWKEKMRFKL